jgi:hypothetical protein
MAYIHYNCDRLLKLNENTTSKLELLDKEDSSKSVIKQSQKTKALHDETLVNNFPPVIGFCTTGLLFVVFFMTAIGEAIVIASNMFFPAHVFTVMDVGTVLLIEMVLIIASMWVGLLRLKNLNNFVTKRKNNYDNICEKIEVIKDAINSTADKKSLQLEHVS